MLLDYHSAVVRHQNSLSTIFRWCLEAALHTFHMWSMPPPPIVGVGLTCLSFKGIFGPPDKCRVIDQSIQFAVDHSAPSLSVHESIVEDWDGEPPHPPTSPSLISDSSCLTTHTHTQDTARTHRRNGSPCLNPHLWSQLRFWLVLKCCKVRGALCVSGVSWCCQIKVLSSGGVVLPQWVEFFLQRWWLFWNPCVYVCSCILGSCSVWNVQEQMEQVKVLMERPALALACAVSPQAKQKEAF